MYKLNLEAASLPELAMLVKSHHEELQKSMGTYQSTLSNIIAANSHFSDAPTPSVVATAGNLPPASVEIPAGVDSNGLPWDERIHSSSKKTTANGSWARRKNVDENTFNQVVAELRARGNGGTGISGFVQPNTGHIPPAAITPTPPIQPGNTAGFVPAVPMMPNPPTFIDNQMPPYLQNQPSAAAPMPTPPVAAPAMPPAPPAAPVGQTITDLFNKVQQMFQNKVADVTYLNSLTSRLSQRWSLQIMSINDIGNRPDIIADAFAIIAADGR